MLMEQWASCCGVWTQSDFFLQIKVKRRNRSFGGRRWLTRMELITKYGAEEIAEQIIEAKQHDAEASKNQVRAHPDLHGQLTPDRVCD